FLFHVSMMTPKNDRSSGHCDLNKIAVFIVNRGLVNGYAPFVDKDVMTQHLRQISEATGSDRYALIITDGAPWHTNETTEAFDNLSILKLPPYSPELNPIEQVWQWLRQHCLANRCFRNYDDIVEQCCSAWNKFIDCTNRVKSMCSRS
ncbi:transposase, partial [Shewanella surugensis]